MSATAAQTAQPVTYTMAPQPATYVAAQPVTYMAPQPMQYVNELGQPCTADGQPLGEPQQFVNELGQPCTADGQPLGEPQQFVNEFGQPCTADGQPLGEPQQFVNELGQPCTADGQLLGQVQTGMPIYFSAADTTMPMAMVTSEDQALAQPMPAELIPQFMPGGVPMGFMPMLVGGAPVAAAVQENVGSKADAATSDKKKNKSSKSQKKAKASKKKKGCC